MYETENGNGVFKGTPIYFYKPMTLTAYYPFAGKEGTIPGNNGIITAVTDVAAQDPAKQPSIDFLWDCKKGKGVDKDQVDFSVSDPNVKFTFTHKMSKITFTFKSSEPVVRDGVTICDGVDVRSIISYKIDSLGIVGTFDTATGVCAIDPDQRDGLTMPCEKTISKEDKPDYKSSRTENSIIVFPQKKPEDKNQNFVLIVTTDEFHNEDYLQKYRCQLPFTDRKIEPGVHYNYSVQVTKMGLIVGELVIEPWNNPGDKSLTATIDGDPDFKPESDQTENQ